MKAHLRYLSYVLRHKWFVLLAGIQTEAPWWRLVIHDWSKFTLSEWLPYVRYFYIQPTVGDRVLIDSHEGFGGWAKVVGTRPSANDPKAVDCRVVMEDGTQPGFWAWSFEVKRPTVQAAFDRAWLHHQHAAPHHWQHWTLREDSGATKLLEMPKPLVREMVADWMGAGRAITGKWEVRTWYEKNRDIIQLHPHTRIYLELVLACLRAEYAEAA